MSTRLWQHRYRYLMGAGEPTLKWSDLTKVEQSMVWAQVYFISQECIARGRPEWGAIPLALAWTLEEYGILCWHPEEWRTSYEDPSTIGYDCQVCHVTVRERRPAEPEPAPAHYFEVRHRNGMVAVRCVIPLEPNSTIAAIAEATIADDAWNRMSEQARTEMHAATYVRALAEYRAR